MILSTYEYTALQQEEQLQSFQLKDVLNVEEDLPEGRQRDLMDLTRLCIAFNVKPTVAPTKDKSDGLQDLLEQKVKEVAFLYTYLNEKI